MLVSDVKVGSQAEVFKTRVLRKMFGLLSEEVTGERGKLCNEGSHYW